MIKCGNSKVNEYKNMLTENYNIRKNRKCIKKLKWGIMIID